MSEIKFEFQLLVLKFFRKGAKKCFWAFFCKKMLFLVSFISSCFWCCRGNSLDLDFKRIYSHINKYLVFYNDYRGTFIFNKWIKEQNKNNTIKSFPQVLIGTNHCNNPGTPVFTHFTSARRRYAPHDVAVKNKTKKLKGNRDGYKKRVQYICTIQIKKVVKKVSFLISQNLSVYRKFNL